MRNRFILIFIFFTKVIFAQNNEKQRIWDYPVIKSDTAVDFYYSHRVVDFYRNLENCDDESVKSWMTAQNNFYDRIISNITYRDTLKKLIKDFNKKQTKYVNFPRPAGDKLFLSYGFYSNANSAEILGYITNSTEAPVELFNTTELNLKDSCIYDFSFYEPSFNGKYIAFGLSPNANEKAFILIMDVENKILLPERIERAQIGNIQWVPDGSGFFYTRLKELRTEEDKKTPYEDFSVVYHKLNTDSKDDKIVFSRLTNQNLNIDKIEIPLLFTFKSSDKVLINTVKGTGFYFPVYYANLKDIINLPVEKVCWTKVCDENAKIGCNALIGNKLFGFSFKEKSDGQLISIELPSLKQKIFFEPANGPLDDMVVNDKFIYVSMIEKGNNKMIMVDSRSSKVSEVNLPFPGSLYLKPFFNVTSYSQESDKLIFVLTNFSNQLTSFECNGDKVLRKNIFPVVNYMDSSFEVTVEEIEVPLSGNIKVPLSIVYKKGLVLNGNNPTILEAYGAYGYSMRPYFKANLLLWLKYGGIYAIAHVRGGGEKGDNWYKGGFKSTKSNSWKDLISCSEFMIQNKYTSQNKLALTGASAGGIAVGRAITERPDLCKAAVIYNGIINPLRMETSFNNTSITEFGTVKDSLEFHYLLDMDTYHHIFEGINYPSVLFTASYNDSRVAPWLSAKGVAKMQQNCKTENIILYRIEDSGHFSYPSEADVYSFLFWQLNHPNFKYQGRNNN